jgi:hypothetical protein
MKIMKAFSLALAIGLLVCSSAPASVPIEVTWDPATCRIIDGIGLQGSLSIYADVPTDTPIVAWGLDLYFDEAIVSVSSITYGADWSEVSHDPTAQDLIDGVDYNMAAISLFPPGGLAGHVLLANLTFTGLAIGDTDLVLGAHNPPDLSEGFAQSPPPSGVFVPFNAAIGCIEVVPEPATLFLLGFAGLAVIRRR